jgi:hypothetical protein
MIFLSLVVGNRSGIKAVYFGTFCIRRKNINKILYKTREDGNVYLFYLQNHPNVHTRASERVNVNIGE